jgi:TPR repeat protein
MRKAAEQNLPQAQYLLGISYNYGHGVAKDYVEAVKWFRKAAEQNFGMAQYSLALCYGTGQGVAKDEVEAFKWLILSAAQGNEHAKEHVTVLEEGSLSPDQIAEGKRRANDWLEKYKKPW